MRINGFPRATAVRDEAIPRSTSLVIDKGVPGWDSVAKSRAFYRSEARRFLNVLLEVTPSGFIDALAVELDADPGRPKRGRK